MLCHRLVVEPTERSNVSHAAPSSAVEMINWIESHTPRVLLRVHRDRYQQHKTASLLVSSS